MKKAGLRLDRGLGVAGKGFMGEDAFKGVLKTDLVV